MNLCSDSGDTGAGESVAVEGEEAAQNVCSMVRDVWSDLFHKSRRLHCDRSQLLRSRQRGINPGRFPANIALRVKIFLRFLICSVLILLDS